MFWLGIQKKIKCIFWEKKILMYYFILKLFPQTWHIQPDLSDYPYNEGFIDPKTNKNSEKKLYLENQSYLKALIYQTYHFGKGSMTHRKTEKLWGQQSQTGAPAHDMHWWRQSLSEFCQQSRKYLFVIKKLANL